MYFKQSAFEILMISRVFLTPILQGGPKLQTLYKNWQARLNSLQGRKKWVGRVDIKSDKRPS